MAGAVCCMYAPLLGGEMVLSKVPDFAPRRDSHALAVRQCRPRLVRHDRRRACP